MKKEDDELYFGENILRYREDIIQDIKELVSIPSCAVLGNDPEKPFGEEPARALGWILHRAEELGLTAENVGNYAGHAEYGEGKEVAAVLTHVDVVPAGDGWASGPFAAVEQNGKLYGRGVADDKGAAVVALYCLKALKDGKIQGKRRLRAIFGAGEEVGMHDMERYFQTQELPVMAFTPDSDYGICNREKGILHLELSVPTHDGTTLTAFRAGAALNSVPDKAYALLDCTEAEDHQLLRLADAKEGSFAFHYTIDGMQIESCGKASHAMEPYKGEYAFLMLACALVNQVAGMIIEAKPRYRKVALVGALALSLGSLGYFKYAGFIARLLGLNLAAQIHLPLGISFYTFQALSYTIDVYRGTKAQRSFVNFAGYLTLFPQLVAGPIVRYSDVADQLENRRETVSQFADGVRRFVLGFAKKILLANAFGKMWVLVQGTDVGALGAWLGALAYTLQIYFDFAGYSDMAIGLGRMFGFEFLENFNFPYISRSITEFWRRWHMSLSTWFRDYLYIPLGGSRKGKARTIVNLLIVWLATGLWHGASENFVLWGLYYFVLLVLEKTLLRRALAHLPGWCAHGYALFFVVLGWMLFYFESLPALGAQLSQMFSLRYAGEGWLVLRCLPMLAIGGICSTPWGARLVRKGGDVGLAILFLLGVAAMVSDSYNPFLYFRF